MQIYLGDVSLCYTYSLAMALEAYGYDLRPEYLEALMLMGNGASIVKDDQEHPKFLRHGRLKGPACRYRKTLMGALDRL